MNIDKMIQDCKLKMREEYKKGSLVSNGLEYKHIANAIVEETSIKKRG